MIRAKGAGDVGAERPIHRDDDRDADVADGVPVKALREYEDAGLIYTVGRSPGNYRLFDDTAAFGQ